MSQLHVQRVLGGFQQVKQFFAWLRNDVAEQLKFFAKANVGAMNTDSTNAVYVSNKHNLTIMGSDYISRLHFVVDLEFHAAQYST